MTIETVEALVEGGKASAAPPLGPALGPLGVNIGDVVAKINEKTASFKGMQVPVKVIVDSENKSFEISIGTPPVASLIIKEANIKKGSGKPNSIKVADLKIPQIIKVAKMKEDALLGSDLKNKIKEIIGTCDSMGVLVEGKQARETIQDVNEGMFDKEIKEEKTELTQEEKTELEAERKELQAHAKEVEAEEKAVAEAAEAEKKDKEEGSGEEESKEAETKEESKE
jgi:large subunit ribosomal protein L11